MTNLEELKKDIIEFKEKTDLKYSELLNRLVKAIIEKVEKSGKWIPEIDEIYWYYNKDLEKIDCKTWLNSREDNIKLKNKVVFKTGEEAQEYADYQKAKEKYTYEFSREEWESKDINKYYIFYSRDDNKLGCNFNWSTRSIGKLYFKAKEEVQEFINKYEKQILKFEFEVE